MRHHEAYKPQPYAGDGTEVVKTLTADTNTPKVLAAVARWHEAPRRKGRRHAAIAARLREVSGTVPQPANDNRRPKRERAA